MTPSILGLTFNDLTSLYRARPDINTSKSETDPVYPAQTETKIDKTTIAVYIALVTSESESLQETDTSLTP